MLHEILLSLSGYPGNLFIESPQGTFKIVREIPFIHPSESSILDRIAEIVSCHQQIQTFMKNMEKRENQGKTMEGTYMKAFSRGLDLVLDPYRQLILKMESELLQNPHLPISYLQKSLEEYHLLFPSLLKLVEEVKNNKINGCNVFDTLYKHKSCGIPSVNGAIKIIMRSCHKVLLKQISSWLLYGLLLDPHNEFFIQKRVGDDCCGGGNGYFVVQPSLLPIYVPTNVAEKICFVGESIKLLESKENKGLRGCVVGVVGRGEREKFVGMLMELEECEEFDARRFEGVVNEIRACVAEQLWKLVVEEVDLVAHLRILKDFFLLGRGELFQAFIEQSSTQLQTHVTPTTEHNINTLFQSALRLVLQDDDILMEKFKLIIKTPSPNPDGIEFVTREIGWNNLTLNYDVPWPLHIIFTKTTIDKYNVMFRFLMSVKRVQLDLQHCWTLQMQWKCHKRDQSFPLAWKLRNLMAFVINNIQYYLQVDVLESQHSLLVEKVEETHDFEAIKLAHEQFIVCLLEQSFLTTKTVSRCIVEMMDLCIGFCQQFVVAASLPPRLSESYPMHTAAFTKKVVELHKLFKLQASLLFQILSSSQTYQATPFVAQLLMRLDFNNFFSSGQLGL